MNIDRAEKSATVAIRACLWAQRSALATVARDVGVPAETLDAFVKGAGLAPAVLEKLVTRFWAGSFSFDAATDGLRSTNTRKPIPIGTGCVAKLVLGDPPRGPREPMPMRTVRGTTPPPPPKPGWIR